MWVAVAFAVAVLPDLLCDALFIDQLAAGAVVLWEQLVQVDVLPLYENVALIATDQSTVPLLFL